PDDREKESDRARIRGAARREEVARVEEDRHPPLQDFPHPARLEVWREQERRERGEGGRDDGELRKQRRDRAPARDREQRAERADQQRGADHLVEAREQLEAAEDRDERGVAPASPDEQPVREEEEERRPGVLDQVRLREVDEA